MIKLQTGCIRTSTVRDVARLAGVSTATVSRVVNAVGTVSNETKARVLAAISGLHFVPNAHAAELGRANSAVPRKRS